MIALILAGIVLVGAGAIWLLIVQFQTSLLWGLESLLLPLVGLIFVFLYWQDSKNAFFVQLLGGAFILAAMLMAPGQAGVSG